MWSQVSLNEGYASDGSWAHFETCEGVGYGFTFDFNQPGGSSTEPTSPQRAKSLHPPAVEPQPHSSPSQAVSTVDAATILSLTFAAISAICALWQILILRQPRKGHLPDKRARPRSGSMFSGVRLPPIRRTAHFGMSSCGQSCELE